MVHIKGFKAFRPRNAEIFCTPPYDVIEKEQESELKKESESAVHIILPDGEGEEVYKNAKTALQKFIDNNIVYQEEKEAIYLYRQEALDGSFAQEGLIMAVSIEDYEKGLIKKHEHTREKPLKDRTAHITATHMNTGLVWTTYKSTEKIAEVISYIKGTPDDVVFNKYGYKQILWKCEDIQIIEKLKTAFKDVPLYIADGHHRAASAAAFRSKMIEETGSNSSGNENWNFFMTYAACDTVVRILPYNRVIVKLPMEKKEFLKKVMENFALEIIEGNFTPKTDKNIGMFFDGKWYNLMPKQLDFGALEKNLDVAILQDLLIDPILGIKDIRKSDNIFFVGGVTSPEEMANFVEKLGNDIFFSLYPVQMRTIEDIADMNKVMPPKSTWFDPKLLTGLVFNPLD